MGYKISFLLPDAHFPHGIKKYPNIAVRAFLFLVAGAGFNRPALRLRSSGYVPGELPNAHFPHGNKKSPNIAVRAFFMFGSGGRI